MNKLLSTGKNVVTLILQVAFLFQIPNAACAEAAEEQKLREAVKLFNVKNYKQALPLLTEVCRTDSGNSLAILYTAHTYYYLSNLPVAKQLYTHITKTFPNSNEAPPAALMLTKISTQETTQQVATLTKAAPAAAVSTAAGDVDLTKNIKIVRPQGDHPQTSTIVVDNVTQWLKKLPKPIAELLAKDNITFSITPTLIDLHPEYANTEGPGYDGATLKQCPGMFEPSHRRVVLCERVVSDSDNSVSARRSMDDLNDTFFHELGHAIDACMEGLSNSSEFNKVYRFDEANLRRGDPQAEAHMAYFLQKANRGPTEAFAELTGVLLGIKRKAGETEAAFPNTITYLKGKLRLK